MSAYIIKTDLDRFIGLLEYLNGSLRKNQEATQKILIKCANRLLMVKASYRTMKYSKRLQFHIWLKRRVEPVLDKARIKIRPFRRTWGSGVEKRAMISTNKPLLILKPEYMNHFYELLQLAADYDAVERFSRCLLCNNFFVAKKKGTKFCSIAHSAEFHNRQPDRKSKVKEAVARCRLKKMRAQRAPELREFLHGHKLRAKDDWSSAMEAWNQNYDKKRTWKFESVAKFKREYEWVLGKHRAM
jgi:hypothetical protein